jgi:ribonucleotide reductase alpha subunit
VKQSKYIDQAADRAPFICQSQSMNIFLDVPDFKKLNTVHFYTWKKGLKTGMYYLRTKPRANTQQFTIDPTKAKRNYASSTVSCNDDSNSGPCESCSA